MSYDFDDFDDDSTLTVVLSAVGTLILLCCIICGLCCCIKRRRNQGKVIGMPNPDSAPVVVNSVSHTAPGGYPVTQQVGGYPVTQMPQPAPGYHYPPQGGVTAQMQMPMPMPMPMAQNQPPPPGMQQYGAAYPPANSAAQMNPPSYDAVVGASNASQAASNTPYTKQSAYNPSFTAQ